MSFKEKLAAFMYGRYGIDELSCLLMILSVVLSVVRMFIPSVIAGLTIYLTDILLLVVAAYRMFSKNTVKRRRENEKFKSFFKPIKAFFSINFNRIKYRKTHVYRKCPHCKNMLRLPRVKGKHHAACPVCGESFEVNI